jgi:DMSO/TMAO reductase YedYZ molybdopterin-dependent catalytic subunit
MNPAVLIVWEMNGAPLPAKNGGPVRLVVPGWYGVCNGKWLNHVQVQDRRFMGRFMARDYVTLIERKDGPDDMGRNVGKPDSTQIDGGPPGPRWQQVCGDWFRASGPWQAATMGRQNTKYSWKLFTYEFPAPEPGDHTIVSRATDVNGAVQPEAADLQTKKSRWENNGQFVRKFKV